MDTKKTAQQNIGGGVSTIVRAAKPGNRISIAGSACIIHAVVSSTFIDVFTFK